MNKISIKLKLIICCEFSSSKLIERHPTLYATHSIKQQVHVSICELRFQLSQQISTEFLEITLSLGKQYLRNSIYLSTLPHSAAMACSFICSCTSSCITSFFVDSVR